MGRDHVETGPVPAGSCREPAEASGSMIPVHRPAALPRWATAASGGGHLPTALSGQERLLPAAQVAGGSAPPLRDVSPVGSKSLLGSPARPLRVSALSQQASHRTWWLRARGPGPVWGTGPAWGTSPAWGTGKDRSGLPRVPLCFMEPRTALLFQSVPCSLVGMWNWEQARVCF